MGMYTLVILLVEGLLIALAVCRGQQFALGIFCGGILVLLFLVGTITCQISYPYQKLGLSIYLVIIACLMLLLSGGIGLVVRLTRKFM